MYLFKDEHLKVFNYQRIKLKLKSIKKYMNANLHTRAFKKARMMKRMRDSLNSLICTACVRADMITMDRSSACIHTISTYIEMKKKSFDNQKQCNERYTIILLNVITSWFHIKNTLILIKIFINIILNQL